MEELNSKEKKKSKTSRIVWSVLILSAVFGAGIFAGQNIYAPKKADFNFSPLFNRETVHFSLIEEVWNLINANYAPGRNGIDKEALIFGAIRGMLEQLDDPYTAFLTAEETRQFLNSVSGIFEGIGIEIGLRDDILTVIAPLRGSPAERAGLLAGDKIINIDGESTENMTLEVAVSKIRGTKGTAVVLTIKRNQKHFDVTIIRDSIEVPSVSWELVNDNIAYIELIQFSDKTKNEFSKIAQEILDSQARAIILDLRNNSGGFLDASIDTAGWFLDAGKVVVIEEFGDGALRNYKSLGPGSLKEFPLVVLINEGSASASEILAGALRDQNDAVLVGKQSFGKGSVQALKSLSGGTSLKLTTSFWLTPSKQRINDTGITPTVKVERTPDDINADIDPQKDKAIELLKDM
jgi:carboxyl-terminal processing protease